MRFDIYGRFRVDVQREADAWAVYRSESGKRTPLHDIIIPPELHEEELAVYLDDLFHEYASTGQTVTRLAD